MTETARNGNGFRIKGWRDILTIVSLCVLGVSLIASAVVWGVLIEQTGDLNSNRITALETRVEARPDPFTGSDAAALEARLQRQIDELLRRSEQ